MEIKEFSTSGIRHFITYLIEKFPPFKNPFLILISIVTPILLGIAIILGWMSFKKVKDVVTNDFNQQQLVIAHHVAQQIENNLNTLKKELSLLSLSPSMQYFENVSIGKRMGITFLRIKEEGVLEIRYVESAKSKTYVVDNYEYQTVHPNSEDIYYLDLVSKEKNKGDILTTEVSPVVYGSGGIYQIIMKMILILPVWQVSIDESHPVATNKFSGALLFIMDATALTEKITKDIRSGETGYAWVMNEKGLFLYHPEKEFIGKNAFEARKEKKPTISFARINEIQKKMMLAGKEGTSWYISGWHRGVEGEIKKLIAYAPIMLNKNPPIPPLVKGGEGGFSEQNERNRIWSVAVVAPISEVEDTIHSTQLRLFFLEGIITIAILTGGLLIIGVMHKWSLSLKNEIGEKTIEVKKSEQQYKSLVENAEDIIFTVDHNGDYLSINKYGAKFFNKTPEEIIGHNMLEILSWPSAETPLMMIKEVFKTKESKQITHPVWIGEHEYWLNTNVRRLWDKEGNIYAVLGISRDITDRKKIEEHSYHTEKLASMGTLAAGVAHEINNPLGIILGFTDILLEKSRSDSQEHEILKTIEKHGLRAKRVVENLLSFARYTERKEEIVDINKGITTVLAVVENTFLVNKIFINQHLQEDLPEVKGCSEELQQVFFNIINNAISAMKGGGILTIMTKALNNNNEQVEIKFADTGHGIKKEFRRKIFDPLFTTKKIGEGTGLGLSVSYGIITKHGGTITFETKTEEESENIGTTFTITLPAIK